MVSFSDAAETLRYSTKSTCYRTELAKATPSNIAELKKFVDNLYPGGKCLHVNIMLDVVNRNWTFG